jgi:hypothetical protein
MKKKIPLLIILVILILLLAPRLFVASLAAWNYASTDKVCSSEPGYIISVKPFVVITDRGKMYLGDEYVMIGEGAWYGTTTLIFAGIDGAYFYDISPIDDPVKGQVRIGCKLFVPVGDY